MKRKRKEQHQIMEVRDGRLLDLTERWRYLLPNQHNAVILALSREEKRLMGWATSQRAKGDRPEPFGRYRREAAVWHACRAGAVRIARLMLERIGGHQE